MGNFFFSGHPYACFAFFINLMFHGPVFTRQISILLRFTIIISNLTLKS